MMSNLLKVTFKVNGSPKTVEVDTRDSLLDVLRDSLNLTGPKKGCDETVCGACAVLVNGKAICSCTMLAVEVEGLEVVTIEAFPRTTSDRRSRRRSGCTILFSADFAPLGR